jgi:hypothetical protein
MNLTITGKFYVTTRRKGRKGLASGSSPTVGHLVPRVAKLMALARRLEQLVSDGVVANYAELARLGRVTGARLTQIMNLLNLAPDIQEEILFLKSPKDGRQVIFEPQLRAIVAVADWEEQRRMWRKLKAAVGQAR